MKNIYDANKDVKIFDDFFTPDIHQRVLKDMMQPKWNFCGGRDANRFWHIDGLHNNTFYSMTLFDIIKERTGLHDYGIQRVYANGQTACQSGSPHYDDGDLTFLYYPTENVMPTDGGHLVFLDSIKQTDAPRESMKENAEITRIVQYKCNRGILFPARIGHYAEAPNRHFIGLRISIAWKLSKF